MTKTRSILPRLRALGQALACFALLLAADRPARADAIVSLTGDVALTTLEEAVIGTVLIPTIDRALIFKEHTNHLIPVFSELDPAYIESVLGYPEDPAIFIGLDYMQTEILEPGSYGPTPLLFGMGVPSGTSVSTYIVHWDPLSPAMVIGSVTFDSDVLALQTTYGTPLRERLFARPELRMDLADSGLEISPIEPWVCAEEPTCDHIILSADRRTVFFTMRATTAVDGFRVYVAPVPEPSLILLVGGGLLGMLVTRRRWRQ